MVKKAISKEREERLTRLKYANSNRYFIINLAHGLTYGPIDGLMDIMGTIHSV